MLYATYYHLGDTFMSEPTPKKQLRRFDLYEEITKKKETLLKKIGTFTGQTPAQAARKAATREHKSILLREHGKNDLRIYEGSIEIRTLVGDQMPAFRKEQALKDGNLNADGLPTCEIKVGKAKYLRLEKNRFADEKVSYL